MVQKVSGASRWQAASGETLLFSGVQRRGLPLQRWERLKHDCDSSKFLLRHLKG